MQTAAAWVKENITEMVVSVEDHVGEVAFSLKQIRPGMEVKSAGGVKLSKITEAWVGTDPVDSSTPWDDDTCSRLEVRQRGSPIYIPYSAIAGVSGKEVTLNVDAATVHAKPWRHRPPWLPSEEPTPISRRVESRSPWS